MTSISWEHFPLSSAPRRFLDSFAPFAPTERDLTRLRSQYPEMVPESPDWGRIRRDLLARGFSPHDVDGLDAASLVALATSSRWKRFPYRPISEAIAPTSQDLSRLQSAYPEMDVARPEWALLRAELLARGLLPAEVREMDATTILCRLTNEHEAPKGGSQKKSRARNEKPKWLLAAEKLKEIARSGESFTNERDIAARVGFSQKTVQTAFKKTEEIQKWRNEPKDPAPPEVESLKGRHLDSIPAADQSSGISEGEVQHALEEICAAAEPLERERIQNLEESERCELARLYLSREWGPGRDRQPERIAYRKP